MKHPNNQKKSSAGDGLTVNKSGTQERLIPPELFKNFIQSVAENTIDKSLCDDSEIHYLQVWISENSLGSDPSAYWELLSLQEQKVIHSLNERQIPPYIAYRRAFKDGQLRYQNEKKPVFCLIELASACNIKCPFCFQSDPTFTTKEFMGFMDIDLAKKIIDEIDELKVRGITFASRGEPLLYRYLQEILDYIATKENILEIKINTNAKRLNQSNLEVL